MVWQEGPAMKEYVVLFERAGANYSAYVPDLPGCISTGATLDETEANIREAIELYLAAMADDGLPAPEPLTQARGVRVSA